jgi:hypothetical protein
VGADKRAQEWSLGEGMISAKHMARQFPSRRLRNFCHVVTRRFLMPVAHSRASKCVCGKATLIKGHVNFYFCRLRPGYRRRDAFQHKSRKSNHFLHSWLLRTPVIPRNRAGHSGAMSFEIHIFHTKVSMTVQ